MKAILGTLALCSLLLIGCETNSPSAKNSSLGDTFINLDVLENSIKTTFVEFEYAEDELIEWSKQEKKRDYTNVIEDFVKQELKQTLSFIDSVDGTYNPKRMIIGTGDNKFYEVELNRWHNYNGIWTVKRYTQLDEAALTDTSQQSIRYERVELNQAEKVVQDWVKELVEKQQRREDFLLVNEDTYILLTAAKGESVELLEVWGNDERVIISHANSTIAEDARFGELPYVLLHIRSPVLEVKFNQFSHVKINHTNIYNP